ncbi:M12 family metallo-peptidase [Flavobacterium sp. JP2137]|uniref:M12 family metallo-peptidase n=1 Tax=Flavobacterium sp. JP2137 TaxID=3414510 RepID=UPI003D2FA46B
MSAENVVITDSNRKQVGNQVQRDIKVNVTLAILNTNNSDLSKTIYNNPKGGQARFKNFEGKAQGYKDNFNTADNITEFTVSYRFVNSVDDIRKDEHVLVIGRNVDNDPNSSGSGVGIATLNGRVSGVSSKTIDEGLFNHTAQHELGHNLGLNHSEIGDLMHPTAFGNSNLNNKKRGDIISNQISPNASNGVYKESDKYKKTSGKETSDFIKGHQIK